MDKVMAARFNELFNEFVPCTGKADTVAGEIVRAYSRIVHRFYNDGDQIGVDYGNETCNPAARFLCSTCGRYADEIIEDMWTGTSPWNYEEMLCDLGGLILEYLDNHPELFTETNHEDMLDYLVKEDTEWEMGDDYDVL